MWDVRGGDVKSTQSGIEWKKLSGLGSWVMCAMEGTSLKKLLKLSTASPNSLEAIS